MKNEQHSLGYVLGFIEATLGSANDYKVADYRKKLAYLADYVRNLLHEV